MMTHVRGIGYFHKLKMGINPVGKMPMVQLMMKGMRSEKGSTARKLPFMVDDIRSLNDLLNLATIDRKILWSSALLGCFFMLRMSEFLKTHNKNMSQERRPILIRDIAPRAKGVRTRRGTHVDETSVHISGPKTGWMDQRCIKSHAIIPLGSNNSDLCVVRALIDLREAYMIKFSLKTENILASRRHGNFINIGHLAALMWSDVFKKGMSHASFPLHSIRVGRGTSLYQATKDVEFVARVGRWETKAISPTCGEVTKC